MTWVKKLQREYISGRKKLESYKKRLVDSPEEASSETLKELQVVNGMIADMNYAIEWMQSGREPHSRHGADVRDAYKRSILMDMDLIPAAPPEEEKVISSAQKEAAVKILLLLSPRELECYLLHASNGLSLSDIGKEMKLSKSAVQTYIDRAKAKVAQAI